MGYINFPAAYGILLGRIATTPTAADQELANQCQDEARVDSVKRNVEPIAPPLDLSMLTLPEHRPSDKASIPQAVLRLTAALASYNQSPVLQDRPWIADLLTRSGIKNKVFTCPNNVDLSGGPKYAETQGRAALNADKIDLGNNWSLNFPSCQGTFGSHYAARYYIAKRGYLALTTEQAIYPSLKGHLQIGANEAILLRFSRKPALIPSGFWSLTAYNRAQYLISNEQNRYCIGDRDNMTFVDGTPLGDGSKDGEFCILLQPADVTPPAKWRCNWLPLPAGGGEFSITVRWYGAKKEMYMALTNEFVPKFEWTKAITDSRESKL